MSYAYDLEERLLAFAADIIAFTESMPSSRAGNHVAAQLLRSGTSAYPNHGEAQAAESPRDFIHKLRVCLKELRETYRWLRLADRSNLHNEPETASRLAGEADELIRIFVCSIRTVQKNKPSGKT
jgi:four helix bundle protein